ncbi:MAG: DUF5916 domain-containing protein [Saprospiraceae bacterium]
MRLGALFFLFYALASAVAAAQSPSVGENLYVVEAVKTSDAVRIDGLLDEVVWSTAPPVRNFRYQFPVDTGYTRFDTEVRICFDDKNLYIAAVCRQPRESYTMQSLRRDFPGGASDVLNVLLDPTKDGLNGFLFGVNPLNVQREALIDNGSSQSLEWDNRWSSAVQNYADHWEVEMAIPFKTLRYNVADGLNAWKVNFVRTKLQDWEVSSWYPIPRQFGPINLAFTGVLQWPQAPPKTGAAISLIPYVNLGYNADFQRKAPDFENRGPIEKTPWSIGGDAKIGLGPGLNLDLTFNPDFSQVEVDRQVVNLSRFELFFPERRQFFLENRDLFALFGFPSSRPFFSRRIGLARNPTTGDNENIPILAGARLSGKLTDKLRIGALNMQTQRVDWDENRTLPAANFTTLTFQRKVMKRSALGGILVNKINFTDNLSESQRAGALPWNRVAGLEYNLYSQDNRWEGEWYYHRSFSPDPRKRGQSVAHYLGFSDRRFNIRSGYMLVDSFYTAEMGFVPRKGFQSFFPGLGFNFFPKDAKVNRWGAGLNGDLTYSLFWQNTDRRASAYLEAEMQDQSYASLRLTHEYTYLFEDFDPTNQYREGTSPLPANTGYNYQQFSVNYFRSRAYDLQGSAALSAGQYFNGHIVAVSGEVLYRIQPYGIFALSYNYNRIRLPAPYASTSFWLLGPRAELSFSRSVFLSAFFQYNTQINNFNINTRLQWRFAPVSDLFLVYTDNSFAEAIPNTQTRFLSPKNRALVLKVTYWLNV